MRCRRLSPFQWKSNAALEFCTVNAVALVPMTRSLTVWKHTGGRHRLNLHGQVSVTRTICLLLTNEHECYDTTRVRSHADEQFGAVEKTNFELVTVPKPCSKKYFNFANSSWDPFVPSKATQKKTGALPSCAKESYLSCSGNFTTSTSQNF